MPGFTPPAPRYSTHELVYIGHPLFGRPEHPEWADRDKNVERYLRFVAYATNLGYAVVSWVHHDLTDRRALTRGPAEFYLARDLALMTVCHHFWQAGPLYASSGLSTERDFADSIGLSVRADPEWMDFDWTPPGAP